MNAIIEKIKNSFSVKNSFKDRTVGFYITLGAAALAIVGSIIYLIADAKVDAATGELERTFIVGGFLLMLLGGLSVALTVFTDFSWAPMIPAVCYILGSLIILNGAVPSITDLFNGVAFIGGNGKMGLIFSIYFLVVAVVGVAGLFFKQRKES